jgi:sigma-B regulation protein RsbU (phosphoserine phosphatase)
MERAMHVLAQATSASVALYDASGDLVAGPVSANPLVDVLLRSEAARQALLAAHQASIPTLFPRDGQVVHPLLGEGLERFAVPVTTTGRCAGTLVVGDRPRYPLSARQVHELAETFSLTPSAIQDAASETVPWSPMEAGTARQLATLLAELFAELCTQEKNLRHRIEELSAVYNIAGLLAETMDLQEILNKTARIVCEVMKAKACSIRMHDENTGQLVIKAVHNLSRTYQEKGPVSLERNPIDQAAFRGEMVRIVDAPNDPRTQYPEQARAEGIVSGLVCGLIYRGKAVGILRVYMGERHEFSPFEEALMRGVAAQAAAAVVNARLLAGRLEAERYQRQIAYAGQVQRRMIPTIPPALYRPTYNVGGDFYDIIQLPKGNLGIGIADVSGKGVPASLMMASIRSAMRVYAYFMYDIDRIMAEVNKHVCRETTVSEFATIFYGVLTPDGRRFTYCNAGHDPPLLLRDGRIHYLGTGGMVVGVDPTTSFDRELLAGAACVAAGAARRAEHPVGSAALPRSGGSDG